MTDDRTFWARARDAWAYITAMEPARVQVIAAAVLGLVASLGITLPGWLPERVDLVIVAFFTLVAAIVGAERARRRVTPVAKREVEGAVPTVSPPPVGQDNGWSGPFPPSTGGDNGGVFPPS